MSFRARITIVAALAVAVAVALAGALMYLAVRANLRGELDDSLERRSTLIARVPPIARGSPLALRLAALPEIPPPELGEAGGYAQLVTSDGETVQPAGGTAVLPVSDRTLAVARGERGPFLADEHVDGTHVRVVTVPVRDGLALQLARPLTEIDNTLHRLLAILVGIVGGGVVLAATLGAAVARTGVAPIRRLSEATRRVTSTRDLSQRIEESGKDELATLAGNFNEMMAALEESQRSQRQLVADASHELRTPLTSLRTNVEVLAQNGLPTAEQKDLLTDVVSELEELSVLVGDLVDLAREEADDEPREEVRLDLLVADAVERARRHSPGVRFVTAMEPCIVGGVPSRLDRAVANLLDNAAKWSPPGGTVEVSVRQGEVVVRDHGPGFPEADLPFVFDRFYRATEARGLPGSGLGLAIVRQVAELHGGSVAAVNAAGGGAELHLRVLPTS